MKIIPNAMRDLFFPKTEAQAAQTTQTPQTQTSVPADPAVPAVPVEAALADTEAENEALEMLTADKNLTDDQKRDIKQLLKTPGMELKDKVAAIRLMVNKALPLEASVMADVHQSLGGSFIPEALSEKLIQQMAPMDVLPQLLKTFVDALFQEGGASVHTNGLGPVDSFQEELISAFLDVDLGTESGDVLEDDVSEAFDVLKAHHQSADAAGAGRNADPAQRTEAVVLEGSQVAESKTEDDETAIELWNEEESALVHTLEDLITATEIGMATALTDAIAASDRSYPGRLFLRSEVTVKMQEVKATFNLFQKETAADLQRVLAMDAPKIQAQLLSKTIEAVDQLIMKSDVPLYTSMKMERKLLAMSSDLQNIRQNLEKGNVVEAREALKAVLSQLEAMVFKPSAKKVLYQAGFLSQQGAGGTKATGISDLATLLNKQLIAFDAVKASPRMVLEHLRSLGYNREAEVLAKNIGAQARGQTESELSPSVRDMLMSLEKENAGKDKKRVHEAVVKESLDRMNGQQLINKLEAGASKQTMEFSLPYRNEQGYQEVRVHIEARKQAELLDWENFKMFFVLETKTLGQVGIGIQTVDRKLTLSFKAINDAGLKSLRPIEENLKQDLVGVGYKLVGVHYGLMRDNAKAQQVETEKETPVLDQDFSKGVDVRL